MDLKLRTETVTAAGRQFTIRELNMRDLLAVSEMDDAWQQVQFIVKAGCPELADADLLEIRPGVIRALSEAIQSISGVSEDEAAGKSEPSLIGLSGTGSP